MRKQRQAAQPAGAKARTARPSRSERNRQSEKHTQHRQQQRERRLRGCRGETLLVNFVRPECYADFDRLTAHLAPLLAPGTPRGRQTSRLVFDAGLLAVRGTKEQACLWLAEFLSVRPLRTSQAAFLRYLSEEGRCNLANSFPALRSRVAKALRAVINISLVPKPSAGGLTGRDE